jgi:hypothetical protein
MDVNKYIREKPEKPEKENRSYSSCLGWQRGSEKLW